MIENLINISYKLTPISNGDNRPHMYEFIPFMEFQDAMLLHERKMVKIRYMYIFNWI